jgi:SAM-dependent methyltransferase
MIFELFFPWFILSASAAAFFVTVAKLLAAGSLRTFTSRSAFDDAWFGTLWTFIGPRSKRAGMPLVVPLLEGRLSRGVVHDKPVAQPLHGIVIEVGAGSGMWADAYKKVADTARSTGAPGPSKIYGVEPNHVSAAALRQRVQEIGLADIYEVVPVGIQDLDNPSAWGATIPPGSVDCIVTVQCLCSIPEPDENVALLHKYLKKGGHWYVYEHVRTDRGLFVWWMQRKSSSLRL